MIRDYRCVGVQVTQAYTLACAFVSEHISKHVRRVSTVWMECVHMYGSRRASVCMWA